MGLLLAVVAGIVSSCILIFFPNAELPWRWEMILRWLIRQVLHISPGVTISIVWLILRYWESSGPCGADGFWVPMPQNTAFRRFLSCLVSMVRPRIGSKTDSGGCDPDGKMRRSVGTQATCTQSLVPAAYSAFVTSDGRRSLQIQGPPSAKQYVPNNKTVEISQISPEKMFRCDGRTANKCEPTPSTCGEYQGSEAESHSFLDRERRHEEPTHPSKPQFAEKSRISDSDVARVESQAKTGQKTRLEPDCVSRHFNDYGQRKSQAQSTPSRGNENSAQLEQSTSSNCAFNDSGIAQSRNKSKAHASPPEEMAASMKQSGSSVSAVGPGAETSTGSRADRSGFAVAGLGQDRGSLPSGLPAGLRAALDEGSVEGKAGDDAEGASRFKHLFQAHWFKQKSAELQLEQEPDDGRDSAHSQRHGSRCHSRSRSPLQRFNSVLIGNVGSRRPDSRCHSRSRSPVQRFNSVLICGAWSARRPSPTDSAGQSPLISESAGPAGGSGHTGSASLPQPRAELEREAAIAGHRGAGDAAARGRGRARNWWAETPRDARPARPRGPPSRRRRRRRRRWKATPRAG